MTSTRTRPTRTARAVHYPVDDRPPVLVQHLDGRWHPGRLHAWLRVGARDWRAVVSYSISAGMQYYLDVPAGRVRPDGRRDPRPDL